MNTKNSYYYDCEFLEGTQTIYQYGIKTDTILRFLAIILLILGLLFFFYFEKEITGILVIAYSILVFNIKSKKTPPTIDLISIAFVSDDDREYYAISKDFNLKEAWNRYDEKVEIMYGDMRNRFPEGRKYKEYWIRENVLRPIFEEFYPINLGNLHHYPEFNYKNMEGVIKSIGKSNKQIAKEIIEFVDNSTIKTIGTKVIQLTPQSEKNCRQGYVDIDLYGYYSAYDHVCLSWLFGKMIDLPSGFPMYTRDLKQMLDEAVINIPKYGQFTFKEALNVVKNYSYYPKETNSHNALADARWNKQLHQFIKSL